MDLDFEDFDLFLKIVDLINGKDELGCIYLPRQVAPLPALSLLVLLAVVAFHVEIDDVKLYLFFN